MILKKYRVWCVTEGAWKTTDFRDTAPTNCPDNSGHTIDPTKTYVIYTCGDEHPTAEDGKEYVTPDLFPLGYFAVHAGEGDDVANGVIGGGTKMKVVASSEGDTTVDVQFIRHILLAGGGVRVEGGDIDDDIGMTLIAPATAGVSNPGAGAFDKYDVGGFNIFVPNATAEGDWDIDLDETLNANVDFTKAVPVPAGGAGWFDYDNDTNILAVNGTQTGGYNLFDAELPLTCHVRGEPLLGSTYNDLTVSAVKPALCLPHWKFRTVVHHGAGSYALKVRWKLLFGAKVTL